MQQKQEWKKFQRGRGVRVAIKGDINKNDNTQKYRPGIVIKSYPSHVKVQLLSTEQSKYDYFSININNKKQYIRPIYFRTIELNEILDTWKDDNGKIIQLDKKSTFFTKIIEMQYKELFDCELDLIKFQYENQKKELIKEIS